jgi:RNA polymerase sigma factor (sigma-70 family)
LSQIGALRRDDRCTADDDGMPVTSNPTDEDLLGSDDPEDFGVFYDRHIRALLGYFMRRTRDPDVAADLAAETFASALGARRRFRPGGAPASAWLYTIALRRLADYHRRGRVDDRVRRSLAMERRPLASEDARVIRLLADETASTLLDDLPDEQRDAIVAHVVGDRGYGEVAVDLQLTEAAVRQRVSRGLNALRRRLGGAP